MEESNYSSVGKEKKRVDAVEKVTGDAEFTADIELPGMLYGKILGSPHAHAVVKNIDASKSRELQGVKAVLTPDDVESAVFNTAYRFSFPKSKYKFDEKILSRKARFVGDKIATVAAESEEIAEKALEKIEVDYEVLPNVLDAEEAMEEDAPEIHEDSEKNVIEHLVVEEGNVQAGLEQADEIFEDKFKTSSQYHCALEPHVCIADYGADKLRVWSSHQAPFQLRNLLSEVLEIPQGKISVKSKFLGGGFGGKDEAFDELVAASLSEKSGRPVKIMRDRKEDITQMGRRHSSTVKVKAGVKEDGTLTAIEMKTILDGGAYAGCSARVLGANVGNPLLLYDIKNYEADGYAVYTNKNPSGAFRGYGNPQAWFALESMMNIIAEELDISPLELRVKNGKEKGDNNFSIGDKIRSSGLKRCLREGSEAIQYEEKRKSENKGHNNNLRGVGISMGAHPTSATPSGSEYWGASVIINPDASVNLMVGTNEMGQGSATVLAQIAAEELGIETEDISVIMGDTDSNPQNVGSYASKTTHIAGNAVKRAAEDAREKLLEEASKIVSEPIENLTLSGNKVSVQDKNRDLSLPKLINRIIDGDRPQIIGEGVYKSNTNAPSYSAHFVEVEVDPDTSKIEIIKYVSRTDVGQPINPKLVLGQLQGGHHQGMGYALSEELMWDENSGIITNSTILDYNMIPPLDMPDMDLDIIRTEEPTGPFGAKGVGEICLDPVAPALANAVTNAIGTRIKSTPLTREKIRRVLSKKEERV